MTKTTKNAPAYLAYVAPAEAGTPWTRIGAAWPHKDGKGLGIRLTQLPDKPGRIELRVNPWSEGGRA